MNDNLILFIEKAYKLEKSSFWKWAISKHGLPDVSAILNGDWLAHDGLDEEALDAFCLNLRLLIQPRDGFSINQIGMYSDAWPKKYDSIKNEIKLAIEELDRNLSHQSLVQFKRPETTTNNDVFEIIFYGGIAHCNQDKRSKFKELVNSGLFSYFVFRSFVSTLFHYRNCIKKLMRQIPDYLSMESIKFALFAASSRLATNESKLEASIFLQHVLNVNRAWLIAHENEALSPENFAQFQQLIERRENGEPIAYILDYREFFGLKLKVTPDTLIPRPDTETLVDAALAKIPQNSQSPSFPRKRESISKFNMDSRFRGNDEISNSSENTQALRILDLGTGTGAIALAIAKNRPQTQVTAVDFSNQALAVARQNAQNLTILNCQFLQSNWFSALNNQRFDIIVSNPPYIEEHDAHLTQGDLRFEPKSALTSGSDGLDAIRQIISESAHFLNPQGWLMLEHGYNQAFQVVTLLKQAGFGKIETIKDLGGNDRVTMGRMD